MFPVSQKSPMQSERTSVAESLLYLRGANNNAATAAFEREVIPGVSQSKLPENAPRKALSMLYRSLSTSNKAHFRSMVQAMPPQAMQSMFDVQRYQGWGNNFMLSQAPQAVHFGDMQGKKYSVTALSDDGQPKKSIDFYKLNSTNFTPSTTYLLGKLVPEQEAPFTGLVHITRVDVERNLQKTWSFVVENKVLPAGATFGNRFLLDQATGRLKQTLQNQKITELKDVIFTSDGKLQDGTTGTMATIYSNDKVTTKSSNIIFGSDGVPKEGTTGTITTTYKDGAIKTWENMTFGLYGKPKEGTGCMITKTYPDDRPAEQKYTTFSSNNNTAEVRPNKKRKVD